MSAQTVSHFWISSLLPERIKLIIYVGCNFFFYVSLMLVRLT